MNIIKPSQLFVFIATAALLAACGDKTPVQSSVVAGASDAATPNAAASGTATQNLNAITTSDGALVLHVPVEKANNASVKIDGINADDVVFAHREEAEDLTIYAVKSGTPKQPMADYFAKLGEAIKAANLPDSMVYPAQDNRLIYRFSRQENSETLNEACTVVYAPTQIHSVCAISPSLSLSELEATVRMLDPQVANASSASASAPAASAASGSH